MKKFFRLIPLFALLTSCGQRSILEFVPFSSYVEAIDLMKEENNDNYYRHKEVSSVNTECGEINSLESLLVNNKTGRIKNLIDSKGERKILVIPVYFTDSETYNNEVKQKEKTIFIQNAFFGETDHTTYDSVAGYYNKSSYGTLRITGEVASWYNIGVSSNEWKNISSTYSTASNIIAMAAVDYLKENSDIDFSIYDTDDDGYIDGVYVIYDHPFSNDKNSNNFFWAYTYYASRGESGLNILEPYLNGYSWTSVDTIVRKDKKSYTNYLIHETGHLLGLSDYYNTYYSASGNDFHYQPTGCFDMMDYNIGDHSCFSKYLFQWSSPKVIKNDVHASITLSSFNESGDYLLVPSSSYNDSPFSEYLLIEYFTPSGLNKYSGSYSYTDKDGNSGVYTYPQHHGLRIYHVDARLGYYVKNSNSSMVCFVDDENAKAKIAATGKSVGVDYAFNNTLSDAEAKAGHPVLYHLLESSGENTFINAKPANNETLFRLEDDFGLTVYKDFTFNSGDKANFTLKVTKISTKTITLEINRD